MALSPDLKKLARQALLIRKSETPLSRVMDLLATSGGDVASALAKFPDVADAELRRSLHFCAELLRALEAETGVTTVATAAPAPEAVPEAAPAPSSAPVAATHNAGSSSLPPDVAPAAVPQGPPGHPPRGTKFLPSDLRPFMDASARGQVRVAKAYTDGASKGNPGASGIGVAIFGMDGRKIAQQARAIGVATNNIAEYTALTEAMAMAQNLQVKVLHVISDSELMVRQVSGVYKIKNPDILKKVQEVMALKRGFEKFSISYVGREHNTLADALSTSQIKKNPAAPKGPGAGRPKAKTSAADEILATGEASGEYEDVLPPVDSGDEGATG